MKNFLNNVLSGKIDNKYDAEKEYLEKVQIDEELLKSTSPRKGSNNYKLLSFIDSANYKVFGLLFSSQEEDKTDMPALETEESAAQRRNQQGQRFKILTPKQMIIRLPILLPQLKAGNNSEKLKNEIRQIVYSLYRSKNLSKTICNNLINTI